MPTSSHTSQFPHFTQQPHDLHSHTINTPISDIYEKYWHPNVCKIGIFSMVTVLLDVTTSVNVFVYVSGTTHIKKL